MFNLFLENIKETVGSKLLDFCCNERLNLLLEIEVFLCNSEELLCNIIKMSVKTEKKLGLY